MRSFYCGNCRFWVGLVKLAVHSVTGDDTLEHTYVFGHCIRCGSPGILDEFQRYLDGPETSQLYPSSRTVSSPLPPKVRESYEEAIRCEQAGVPIATAVMVRRTLEAIGRSFSPSSRTLYQGLERMAESGAISAEMKEWGDALRFLGNISAHPADDDAVTREEAREAMEFLDAIVETIYRLRPRFEAMKARRVRTTEDAAE